MKAFGYSSYLVGRSRSSPLQQVSLFSHNYSTMSLTASSVFAIQKCDPAPFYLFDEVR